MEVSNVRIPEEYDTKDRMAFLHLLLINLEGKDTKHRKKAKDKEKETRRSRSNWALGCIFQGGLAFIYDIVNFYGADRTRPKARLRQWMTEITKSYYSYDYAISLGKLHMSPKFFRDLVLENSVKKHDISLDLNESLLKWFPDSVSYSEKDRFKKETDRKRRDTIDVYILTRPLKNFAPLYSEDPQSIVKHWAVGCDFGNGTRKCYELVIDQEHYVIRPSWSEWESGTFDGEYRLGKVAKKSPFDVRQLAAKNSFNRLKYKSISQNCHEWAKELLSKMDKNLLVELERKKITAASSHWLKNFKGLVETVTTKGADKSRPKLDPKELEPIEMPLMPHVQVWTTRQNMIREVIKKIMTNEMSFLLERLFERMTQHREEPDSYRKINLDKDFPEEFDATIRNARICILFNELGSLDESKERFWAIGCEFVQEENDQRFPQKRRFLYHFNPQPDGSCQSRWQQWIREVTRPVHYYVKVVNLIDLEFSPKQIRDGLKKASRQTNKRLCQDKWVTQVLCKLFPSQWKNNVPISFHEVKLLKPNDDRFLKYQFEDRLRTTQIFRMHNGERENIALGFNFKDFGSGLLIKMNGQVITFRWTKPLDFAHHGFNHMDHLVDLEISSEKLISIQKDLKAGGDVCDWVKQCLEKIDVDQEVLQNAEFFAG